jgi:hypothetical protein
MADGGFIIETRLVVMRCIAGAVSVEIVGVRRDEAELAMA